jgi:hypothetical protein
MAPRIAALRGLGRHENVYLWTPLMSDLTNFGRTLYVSLTAPLSAYYVWPLAKRPISIDGAFITSIIILALNQLQTPPAGYMKRETGIRCEIS